MSRVKLVIVRKRIKAFSYPHLTTMGYDNGIPFVRYQFFPAELNGHRVNIVPGVFFRYFHCVDCKLMGTDNTMREYDCLAH